MSYSIRYGPGVERDLSRLPRSLLRRIDKAIIVLADVPRPHNCVKLAGHATLYRVRVGDWRIVYGIDDTRATVEIQIIAHRREVYRGL
jgi:mRNA interferase RelE/StbE